MTMSPTPLPKKVQKDGEVRKMNFYDALKEVASGKRVTKLSWEDRHIYLTMREEKLCIRLTEDNQLHPLIVTSGDMGGDDWIVIGTNRLANSEKVDDED